MGIVSALFVILLSVSGLLIHHSSNLSLDQRFTDSPVLLAWYGIEMPDISVAYNSAEHSVVLIADAIYFDTQRLQGNFSSLMGLLSVDFGFVVALNNQLMLLTATGELIEVLGSVNDVPQGIQAIGSSNGDVVLRLGAENGIVRADLDTLSWTFTSAELMSEPIQWSEASKIPEQQAQQNQSHYVNTLLHWERVILDIHSGRFLGSLGELLVDIMACLFVLMALSGVWIWSRQRF